MYACCIRSLWRIGLCMTVVKCVFYWIENMALAGLLKTVSLEYTWLSWLLASEWVIFVISFVKLSLCPSLCPEKFAWYLCKFFQRQWPFHFVLLRSRITQLVSVHSIKTFRNFPLNKSLTCMSLYLTIICWPCHHQVMAHMGNSFNLFSHLRTILPALYSQAKSVKCPKEHKRSSPITTCPELSTQYNITDSFVCVWMHK